MVFQKCLISYCSQIWQKRSPNSKSLRRAFNSQLSVVSFQSCKVSLAKAPSMYYPIHKSSVLLNVICL
jgi:hypothetical protein